ncbi:MAG: hypothetical protein U0798_21555 [Gemmataceae bacterium]
MPLSLALLVEQGRRARRLGPPQKVFRTASPFAGPDETPEARPTGDSTIPRRGQVPAGASFR